MFDFIIKYGKSDLGKSIYNKTLNIYKHKKYNIYEKHITGFTLIGLSHEAQQHTVYEDNDYLIAIIGDIFHNSEHCTELGRLNAQKMLDIYKNSNNILAEVKGEFTIILYKKQWNEIEIINDHFALRPVYYGAFDNDFYISNNLNLFREFGFSVNELAILEKILFTYPISDHSLIENVKELNGGDVLTVNKEGVKSFCRFSLENLVFKNKLNKFSHKKLTDLLNHSVKQRVSNNELNICSLTGGFDGRTIVSSLLKQNIKFFSYSFGKKNGENTEVPLNVSKKISIDYKPIFLEKEYEDNYFRCGVEAIYASDGLSAFDRSNYSFVYNILSKYSHTVFSGLIAGEILRPIHLKHDYLNELYYDLIYKEKHFDLSKYIDDNSLSQFINKEWAMSLNEQLMKSIVLRQQIIKDVKKNHKNGYLFYLYDLISLGFRKFYGNEMHLERFYADNLSPFFDYELLNYLFNSTYIKLFKKAFKKAVFFRWKGQIVYAKIINNNYPQLGEIPVDRGYPPKYLIDPIKKILIPKLYLKRKESLSSKPGDFNGPKWNKLFFKELKKMEQEKDSKIFNISGFQNYIKNYSEKDYLKEINKVISLYYWLNTL